MPLLDLDLRIVEPQPDGPIAFEVRSASWSLTYDITFGAEGPTISARGPDAEIRLRDGREALADFMSECGMTVFFEQEAILSPDGYIVQPDRSRPRFAPSSLEVIDWTGVNIRKESRARIATRTPCSTACSSDSLQKLTGKSSSTTTARARWLTS